MASSRIVFDVSPIRRSLELITVAVIAVAALALTTVVSPPPAAAETAPPFLFSWPASGASGIAINADGVLYVGGGDSVERFDQDGQLLGRWGSSGSGPGQFTSPEGIALDQSGNVYVVDYGNSRVQKFTSTGTFVRQWGTYGTDPGQFRDPFEIAVDGTGNVYVADSSNDRIQKFTADGVFIQQWTTPGDGTALQRDRPNGLAIDPSGNL